MEVLFIGFCLFLTVVFLIVKIWAIAEIFVAFGAICRSAVGLGLMLLVAAVVAAYILKTSVLGALWWLVGVAVNLTGMVATPLLAFAVLVYGFIVLVHGVGKGFYKPQKLLHQASAGVGLVAALVVWQVVVLHPHMGGWNTFGITPWGYYYIPNPWGRGTQNLSPELWWSLGGWYHWRHGAVLALALLALVATEHVLDWPKWLEQAKAVVKRKQPPAASAATEAQKVAAYQQAFKPGAQVVPGLNAPRDDSGDPGLKAWLAATESRRRLPPNA
jgi:hypothetical protein